MAIHFKGEVDLLLPPHEELLREILTKEGFTNCTAVLETVGKRGDNYASNVRRIIAQQDDVNNGKPVKMIVKFAPNQEEIRKIMNMKLLFVNENTVYEEILPKFDELQEEYNIPINERLKHPICYGIYKEEPNEVLILEDITELGYGLFDKYKSMSDEHVKVSLKELAKFHAMSFYIKEQDPVYYESITKRFVNMWVANNDMPEAKEFTNFLENENQQILQDDDHRTRVKGIMSNMFNDTVTLSNKDVKSRYSTIVQGDCWTNNMLFLNQDDKPKDVIMIDYQMSKVASPAADFFYLTLNCTDYETRMKHFQDWLDFYYDTLTYFLSKFDLKADYIYPHKQWEEDLKNNVKLSIAISFIFVNMTVRGTEDAVDFIQDGGEALNDPSYMSILKTTDTVIENYRTKIEGIIRTCIDFGYL